MQQTKVLLAHRLHQQLIQIQTIQTLSKKPPHFDIACRHMLSTPPQYQRHVLFFKCGFFSFFLLFIWYSMYFYLNSILFYVLLSWPFFDVFVDMKILQAIISILNKENFDSLEREILTVWKGKFWQFEKRNFDSLQRKILIVWKVKFWQFEKGNFDSFEKEIFDSFEKEILTVWKGKFWQFEKRNFDSLIKNWDSNFLWDKFGL